MTPSQRTILLDLLTLLAERDMPSNNTEERLVERGADEETVPWCLDVLFNDGKGWLTACDHPKTGERGYMLNARFEDGSLETLFASWEASQADGLTFDHDDEDPDDEWAAIDEDDDD
jgi:hypothetical protein